MYMLQTIHAIASIQLSLHPFQFDRVFKHNTTIILHILSMLSHILKLQTRHMFLCHNVNCNINQQNARTPKVTSYDPHSKSIDINLTFYCPLGYVMILLRCQCINSLVPRSSQRMSLKLCSQIIVPLSIIGSLTHRFRPLISRTQRINTSRLIHSLVCRHLD